LYGVLNLLDDAGNEPFEAVYAVGGGCCLYLVPQACVDRYEINQVWADGQHRGGEPRAGMLAWILTDITAGRARNNIGVTLVQLAYGFLQSRVVRAVR
jgi:hypothetical protein